MIEEIYIDLDGVLCNFPLAVTKLFHSEYYANELVNNWTNDVGDISNLLNITDSQMRERIDATPNFWQNLELYPWSKELCSYLHTVTDEVYICTSPSQNPQCAAGKIEWMYKHKLVKHRNYFITPHKHKLAHPRAVLIDDDNTKCEKFARKGNIVQFPQSWGRSYNAKLTDGRLAIDNKLDYVKERIQILQKTTPNFLA